MSSAQKAVLFAAGGTGGDLFPALAIADQLQQILPGITPVFTGSPDRIEARRVPEAGYIFHPLSSLQGFRGLSSSPLSLPGRIWKSWREILTIARQYNIKAIVCGGNYISFPAGLLAIRYSIPLMITEPNVKPGKTNMLLSRRAAAIITAFQETEAYLPEQSRKAIVCTGTPLRGQISQPLPDKKIAREHFGLNPEVFTILAFGGSLGAASLNRAMQAMLPKLQEKNIQLIWQTGNHTISAGQYTKGIVIRPFINEMNMAYAAADLVISRAGGGTIAELIATGKPCFLLPLPGASNNEQSANAQVLVQHNAGIIITDEQAENRLLPAIMEVFEQPARLESMAQAAAALYRPGAAMAAAHYLAQLIEKK